jgi:hypothetical protein
MSAYLFDNGPSQYAWVITRDHLADGDEDFESEVGVAGPSDAPDDLTNRLVDSEDKPVKDKPKDALSFKIYDDDGIHYYDGWYLGPDGEDMFGPLTDFGGPNAGATTIKYRDKTTGKWETL